MEQSFEPGALIGSWLHSHEEDTPTTTVYRRANYAFPPSRGRVGFELRADGSMIEKGIGPTDRSLRTPGKWQLRTDGCLGIYASSSTQPTRLLPIEAVDEDRLLVRKEASNCPRT